MTKPQTRPLSSTLKTMALLDLIAESSSGVRISELARASGSSRGTVYQQLVTLMAAGWMERLDDGRYRLTLRGANIGHAALEQASLGERIIPALEQLGSSLDCTVSVAILQRDMAVIVQRIEPGRVFRPDLRVGSRFPLSVSATGKILAAFSPDEVLQNLAETGADLPRADELDQVRRQHYATALYMEGVTAIAAPIFDGTRGCVAALSVSDTPGRLDVQRASAALLRSAGEVSRLVGGRNAGYQALADLSGRPRRPEKPVQPDPA